MNAGLERASLVLFCGLVVLIPLVAFPGIADPGGLSKHALLLTGASALLLLITLGMRNTSGVGQKLFRQPGVIVLLTLIATAGIVAFFSLNRYESLFAGQRSVAIVVALALLSVTAMYFSAARLGRRLLLQRILLVSVVLLTGAAAMTLTGFLPIHEELGLDTLTGSVAAVLFLAAAGIPLALGLLTRETGRGMVFAATATTFLVIFGLFTFTEKAWIVAGGGSVLVLLYLIRKKDSDGHAGALFASAFVGILSLVFVLGAIPLIRLTLPVQASPTAASSAVVMQGALSERLLTGYGQNQWDHAYARHLPEAVNETAFWNVRFPAAASEALTVTAEQGILGVAGWLLFVVFAAYGAVRTLFIRQSDSDAARRLPEAAFVFALLIGLFAGFVQNVAVGILLFVAFGLLIGPDEWGETLFDVPQEDRPAASGMLITSAAVAIVLLLVATVSGMRLAASAAVADARQYTLSGDLAAADMKLRSATALEASNARYWQELVDVRLTRLIEQTADGDAKDAAEVRTLIGATREASDAAIVADPNAAAVWAQRARMLSSFQSYGVRGAGEAVIASWDEAIRFEPKHPGYRVERGMHRVSLLPGLSEQERQRAIALAEEDFRAAITLRAAFAEAHYQLAILASISGNQQEAIAAAEAALAASGGDVGYALQLGLLYMNTNDPERAAEMFFGILEAVPDHANARYYLAILEARAGRKTEALMQIDWLIERNPDVSLLRRIRENVVAERDPLHGISKIPGEPLEPITEAL